MNDGQGIGFATRLWDSFYRHRFLFWLSVITVIAVATIALKLRKQTYRAAAMTQVVTDNQELVDALGEQYRYAYVNSAQQNVNQFQDLMGDNRLDGFVDTALKSARLTRPINVDPRAADPRFTLFRKRLVLTADSENLFSAALTWDDPGECERIVTALQAQYIDETGTNRQASAIATTKFLETEILRYEQRMRTAEQALINYKQANSGELPEAQTADIQQLAALKTQHDVLAISSEDSSLRRKALEQRIAQVKPMSVFARTETDGPTTMAVRGLQTKRAQLIADGYIPTSEKVRAADIEIELLTRQANEEIRSAPNNGKVVLQTSLQDNPEFQLLNQQVTAAIISERTRIAQLNQVNGQIAQYEVRISRIPNAQRELTDKTRDYTILKAQYESLLGRREQAQLKASLDKVTARSTLLPVGTVYAEPTTSRSKELLLIAGSVFVGLLVGVLVVLYSEWTDQTLRYGVDAERILGLPLLAAVPETRALFGTSTGVGFRR